MSPSPIEESADGQPLSALEALHSTPSRRYLAPDPIPDDVLWAVLDAAIRGPSGGNRQQWGWVVVTSQEVKDRVAIWYRENWEAAYGQYRERILAGDADSPMSPRGFLGAEHLAHHLEEAPVWVFPVLRHAADTKSPRVGSSIYGAIQQLCGRSQAAAGRGGRALGSLGRDPRPALGNGGPQATPSTPASRWNPASRSASGSAISWTAT